MASEEDSVVHEMELHISQELSEQLYVLQYPLRPHWKPLQMDRLSKVRHRRLQKAVEMHFSMDTESDKYDPSARFPLTSSVMESTLVPAQTNRCIAIVEGGKVHMTPLHAVVQLRPSCAHLDEDDRARREERERDAKADRARASRQDSTADDGVGEGGDEEDMEMLQVQFRRAESEKVLERKRTSYSSLIEARDREPWAELEFHPPGSEQSARCMEALLSSSKSHVPWMAKPHEYLDRLSCTRGARDLAGPIDLEQVCCAAVVTACSGFALLTCVHARGKRLRTLQEPPVERTDTLSKEALRQMPAPQRVEAILKVMHVVTLDRLCELCRVSPESASGQTLLRCVLDSAVLVQGCWVLKSSLAHPKSERERACRDQLLLHFTRARTIKTEPFANLAKLSKQAARDMLSKVAKSRPGSGWEFKLATDSAFMEKYPQIVEEQMAGWARVEQIFASSGTGTGAVPGNKLSTQTGAGGLHHREPAASTAARAVPSKRVRGTGKAPAMKP